MPIVSDAELARALKRDRRAIAVAVESGRLTKRDDGKFDLDDALREWAETTLHEKGHNNRSKRDPATLAEIVRPDHGKLPTDIPAPDIPQRAEVKSTDYAKARSAEKIYDARLKKLRYEERAGHLTPTADVETARFTEFRILREACFNIPSRIAALVAGESEVERCQQILEAELNTVFNAFADGKLS